MTMRAPVIAWDAHGKPLGLANGRTRGDGLCQTRPHAYPAIAPDQNPVEDGTIWAETCVSCQTIRSMIVHPDGTFSPPRYFHARPW